MEKIQSHESSIEGKWIEIEGKVVVDENCARVELLIDSHLQKVAVSKSGWDLIYKDPADNRLWHLTYPQSHMHGGGPPSLFSVTESEAKLIVSN